MIIPHKMKPNRELGLVCAGCKSPIKIGENKIMHHISYYPEIKVPVHKSCHAKIHWGSDYQELLPDFRQTIRFYGYTHFRIKANLDKVIPLFFTKIDKIEHYYKKNGIYSNNNVKVY